MSLAAEHALRTLGQHLEAQALPPTSDTAAEVLRAMAQAHIDTADDLQAQREHREAMVASKPGEPKFNPRGKAANA